MILHRIVGLVRLALSWMVLWGAIGATLSVVIGIVDPPSIDPGEGPVNMARVLGGVGAACGLVFGLLLLVAERRKDLADIPHLRAVIWGVAAGALVPLLSGINDVVVVNTCPLGAITAVTSAGLARMARRPATV